jgi:putative spermidine/putrescine transport system substrate-binding protein
MTKSRIWFIRPLALTFGVVFALVAFIFVGAPAYCQSGQSNSKEIITLNVIDTISGPNFQAKWQTDWIPTIKKELGINVVYTVGSGPTLLQQMKTWQQDRPEFNLLFIKGLDLSNMVVSGIPLEALYPAKEEQIPNQKLEAKEFLPSNNGVSLNGVGLIFWRAQFDLVFNSTFVPNPPKTWKEFYDRRAEFKGHIGIIRPDAGSAGGRAFIYSFLTAFGVDFDKPFAEVQQEPAWKTAWEKFSEFSKYFAQPVASSPPVMFHQFQTEQVWITDYAQDYCLWSTTQGLLPPTTKAAPLDVNIVGASNAWLAVPKTDTEEQKAAAYKVINYLLSPKVQIDMVTTMYEYPGTNSWKDAPKEVWDKIPPVDAAESHGIIIKNFDAITYIQQHGMDYVR